MEKKSMRLMKLASVASLGLFALTGCDKEEICDTAVEDCDPVTDDTDADTDADADTDTDTDTDTTSYFDSYAVGFEWNVGHDGSGLTSYGIDGTAQDPWVTVTFYEESYFDAYDDRYSCSWVGTVVDNGLDTLGADGLWIGHAVSLEAFDTDCGDFDPDEWGGDTPTSKLESMELGIGYAGLSVDFAADLEEAIVSQGGDWSEYDGYMFATWLAFYDEETGALAGTESGWTYAYELDAQGDIAYDAEDAPLRYNVAGGTEMPAPAFVQSGAWQLYYAWAVSGNYPE